ncbi:MAG: hypothetical protein JW918_10740 [Anaerolineae bacterium]|nr:hypothetical protein [Anaerolineae bacterium]
MTAPQAGIVVVLALMAVLVLCGLIYTIVSASAQLGAASVLAPSATVSPRPTNPPTWTPTPTSASTPVPTLTPSPQAIDAQTPVPGERHVESEGGFSYVPPSGWQVVDAPGLKYKVARGTPTGDFTPNLNVVDEPFSGSLDDFVTASLASFKEFLKDVRIVSQEDFVTDEGERGVKVVIEDTQQDVELYQVFYIFDAGAKKIMVTYTRLADQGQDNDDSVDQSMRTFRLEE